MNDARSAVALRKLELLVTRRLDGLLAGDYQGFLQGPGSHAAEGRPYEVGDDVRRIDWNLSARMVDPHVRTTEPDRELTTWVVVDRSASLDFGTAQCEKRDLAVAATAAVGFLTARGGNRIGALLTGGPTLVVLPPRAGAGSVHRILRKAVEQPRHSSEPDATATVAAALERLARIEVRRGFVAVVSDFNEQGWSRGLTRLAGRHQVLTVVASDPMEGSLPPVGLLTLVDPETGRRLEVQTASPKLRQRYAEAAAAQAAERRSALRRSGAAVVELSTDRDWLLDIVRFVAAARRQRTGLAAGVLR